MIGYFTNGYGDVGPVVFDRSPTWWIITSGGLSERFPVRWSGIFDALCLFQTQSVFHCGGPAAADWKVPGVPNDQNRLCQP